MLSFLCPILGCEAVIAHAVGWVYAFPTCSSFYDWISRINGAGHEKPYCGNSFHRKTGPYSKFNIYMAIIIIIIITIPEKLSPTTTKIYTKKQTLDFKNIVGKMTN